MTGPEHYLEAENLLIEAFASKETTFEGVNPEADRLIAAAAVHAQLAQAAATALSTPSEEFGNIEDDREWYEAAGIRSVKRDKESREGLGS